ncbi:uncharacterized protein LOC106073196 isoform X2 [Biomphalaria glabrata]|uniref:Uncharacterized protein LOC106073196 isoform X2 n=1 Tax=Biomphalaria glabrata TaxID=6526 RepID=A0A9W3AAF0_BIOGL|nr:uncharacterized protein LOC106073196 isoform X2 [Biomphalaria glabrata]
MSKGRLQPKDEATIQQNYVYLKENLEALDLVDYLFQCAVITTHDKEQIYSEKIKKHRNEILLNILLNSGAGDSFEIFLKSLEAQYKSVLQLLLGEGRTLKDATNQGQGDSILKKENAELLEALAVEKEKNMKLNIEIDHLKKTQRCLKCRQEDVHQACDSESQSDNTKKKTFIHDIENTTPEFVCELTGLSEIKCVDNCPHIIGQHEHQITKNGETDLLMCKALCKKNPGHVNFIEIDKFGIDDLPEGYRDIEIVEYIKAVAGLTVKISVTKTSPHRPKFWPDTQIPYPLYDVRGQSELRTGSGIISSIYRFRDTVVPFQKCPCHKCRLSDEPSKIWWKIYILTATNLVFDSVEARATRLTLFYDQENGSTITLDQIFDIMTDIKEDYCILVHVTCDKEMRETLSKLDEMTGYHDLVQRKANTILNNFCNGNNFIFIVSHPHGCCKMVSLGQWNEKYKTDERDFKFTYTASTCPGVVGGKVNITGYPVGHVHSGSLLSGLNYTSGK